MLPAPPCNTDATWRLPQSVALWPTPCYSQILEHGRINLQHLPLGQEIRIYCEGDGSRKSEVSRRTGRNGDLALNLPGFGFEIDEGGFWLSGSPLGLSTDGRCCREQLEAFSRTANLLVALSNPRLSAVRAQSRATLEALAKLHQPREQTVRHVHVNEGGQAVIANQVHHHAGGIENGESVEQSHAPGAPNAIAALPGPDPLRDGVPVPSGSRAEAVPHARRD